MLPVSGSTPAGAPATPAAAPSSAPAPSVSTTPASAPSSTPSNDFAGALRKEMESRLGGPQAGSGASGGNALPAGLVSGVTPPPPQPAVPPVPPTLPGAAPLIEGAKTPEPGKEPITDLNAAAPKTGEVPSSLRLEKFGREFSVSEIEAAIEGFNYYHPKVLEIQNNLKAVESAKAEIAALKSSPDMMFLEFMAKSPQFKDGVVALCKSVDGSVVEKYQGAVTGLTNQTIEGLQKTVNEQAAQLKQLQETGQARAEQERQERQAIVFSGLDSKVQGEVARLKGEGIDITENDLTSIGRAARAMMEAKQLAFDVDPLAKFFVENIGVLADRFRAIKNAATSQQAHEKAQLPPPPPSGGAAPVLNAASPTNNSEFSARLAEGLANHLSRAN